MSHLRPDLTDELRGLTNGRLCDFCAAIFKSHNLRSWLFGPGRLERATNRGSVTRPTGPDALGGLSTRVDPEDGARIRRFVKRMPTGVAFSVFLTRAAIKCHHCCVSEHRRPRSSEVAGRSQAERRDVARNTGPEWSDAGHGAVVTALLAVAGAVFVDPLLGVLVVALTVVVWIVVVLVAMLILRSVVGGLSAGTRIAFGWWQNAI